MADVKPSPSSPDTRSVDEEWLGRPGNMTAQDGITLIPRPSDDPRDPLVCAVIPRAHGHGHGPWSVVNS